MDALILVDLQNDFLPGGALAVPRGDEVIPVANRLVGHFGFVVATRDWHPPDHSSFASQHPGHAVGDVIEVGGVAQVLWPDHCVQGTKGAEFSAALNDAAISEIVTKGTSRDIDSYSGFFDNNQRQATGLLDILQRSGITRVHVMGLATDYCVKFTALDALKLGFETNLVLEGCRGVDLTPGDSDRAVDEMRAAGASVR